ncbi:hypothetical protein GCG54_00006507 [Colletotrichum gloeosporioides]|uniref:Uncharacterized protein n=1 Tax=Colletotrichum gloeosporioides TaxID=474922 RepID=A0A8H4FNN2_COLGL|nr:uncharacterized protein GCG54_00006507 [Colletotrichum gloeosporioides]KAF3808641.1 hypothetical protein GCG54_00006507 [Colletotrichum gloeosporioides]
MAAKRNRLGKKQRLARQEKRRQDEAAAANATAVDSATKVYWPHGKNEGPSAPAEAPSAAQNSQTSKQTAGKTNNETHDRKTIARIEKPKRKPRPKKTSRAEFSDLQRRVKLMELHIHDIADSFLKHHGAGQLALDNVRRLITSFNAALALGSEMSAKTDLALAKAETVASELADIKAETAAVRAETASVQADTAKQDGKVDRLQEALGEMRGAISELSRLGEETSLSLAKAQLDLKGMGKKEQQTNRTLEEDQKATIEMQRKLETDMYAMKAQMDALQQQVESMQKTDETKVEKGQGGWKGRLRSRGNK